MYILYCVWAGGHLFLKQNGQLLKRKTIFLNYQNASEDAKAMNDFTDVHTRSILGEKVT